MLNLTSLELEQDREPTHLFPSSQVHPPPLLQSVSKLKSLHFTRVPLYPVLFGIESLVDLKLVDYKFPFQKFIGFLESNLNLEAVELRIEFSKSSLPTTPERVVSLPRLRRLALICNNSIDARALLSSLYLPHGINIGVQGSRENSCGDMLSFLPCPSTHIQDLFAPITTIKYLPSPERLHLYGNNGSLSFHSNGAPQNFYEELDLFDTSAVREFHLPNRHRDRLYWVLERLPALEALIISQGNPGQTVLSVLAKEPLLCPSLKIIAFLDCGMNHELVNELEMVLTKREHSTAARLHQVVIVNRTYDLPGHFLISRIRRIVPRVDVMASDELPDFL